MKNIAIIVPTLNKGGAERVAANLSIEFSKYYNVYLIVHDGNDITYPYKGKLIDLQLLPSNNLFKKIITLIKRVKKIKKIKKKYKIDYSISHLSSSNLANILSKQNDKIYTYIHSMEKPKLLSKIFQKFNAKLSDKVICVSECVRQNMINNFSINENKLVTIYNFCQKIEVNKTSREENSDILIVNMGRLSEPKGQWHLIRAMKYVNKYNKNAKLKIIGEGSYRDILEKLIKDLSLEKIVELSGYIKDPFIELSKGDIYVSSSLWEGLPMALVEAGNCNLPIISTDCDAGCREIIAPTTEINKKTKEIEFDKYGILIPICLNGTKEQLEITEEEKIMGDAILYLINNNSERKKYAKMSELRSKDFLPEKIMKTWKEILK